jgi:hypothetical protein
MIWYISVIYISPKDFYRYTFKTASPSYLFIKPRFIYILEDLGRAVRICPFRISNTHNGALRAPTSHRIFAAPQLITLSVYYKET